MSTRTGTILIALVSLALGAPARADDFHVTTAQELQSALTQAAENGVADTITLAAGSYIGNFNRQPGFSLAFPGRMWDAVS